MIKKDLTCMFKTHIFNFDKDKEERETIMSNLSELKLQIELVPKGCWGTNLRKVCDDRDWNIISRYVREQKGNTCEVCGWKEDRKNRKYTHCHEVWDYNHETKVQSLVKLECLCPDCHAVHHWGHSQMIGRDIDALTKHAIKVNYGIEITNTLDIESVVKEESVLYIWNEHISFSYIIWRGRSRMTWTTDFKGIVKNES